MPAEGDPALSLDQSSGLSIGVEITAAIGRLHSEMRELRRDARLQNMLPHILRQTFWDASGGNGVYATGVNLILSCDGPQQGKVWSIRRIALGGAKANAAGLTGTAYGFVAPGPPLDLSLEGLFFVNTTWSPTPPTIFAKGGVPVNQGENVYVVIVGGTNGDTYGASIQVEEYSRNRYIGSSEYANK